jgi:hypothetical protein
MTKKKADKPKRKIGERTETIWIKLSPMQIEDERSKVIDLLQERDELDERWKSTKADHKAKEAELDSKIESARGAIRTCKVSRELVVEEWVTDRNEVIRIDKATGEEVGRRTATARELQEELDLPEPKAADDDGEDELGREVAEEGDAEDFGDKE